MRKMWLENLCLSENELKVMNALLSIKLTQNVTFIAKKANLPRTTTLYILKKFQKKGLAKTSTWTGGGKRYKKRYHWKLAHIDVI